MKPPEPDPPRPAPAPPDPRAGLCPGCKHVRLTRNDRGSVFLLCGLAKQDARFPRYPPQPRLVCAGFAR